MDNSLSTASLGKFLLATLSVSFAKGGCQQNNIYRPEAKSSFFTKLLFVIIYWIKSFGLCKVSKSVRDKGFTLVGQVVSAVNEDLQHWC